MRTLTATFLALTLLLFSATEGLSADFQKGLDAFVVRDFATALLEWTPLAEQGHAEAQFKLGEMYRYGDGVLQDYAETLKWYRLAAGQGHTRAQNYLGWMYENGVGVLQDYAEAVKWWRMAAEQGSASAQNNLGIMYHYGRGVVQDDVVAHMWWDIAFSQGQNNAAQHRDTIARKMTAAEVSEARRLAQECVQKNFKGC